MAQRNDASFYFPMIYCNSYKRAQWDLRYKLEMLRQKQKGTLETFYNTSICMFPSCFLGRYQSCSVFAWIVGSPFK